MKQYRVLIHVASSMLSTLIALLADHDNVRLVQVTDTADDAPLPLANSPSLPPAPALAPAPTPAVVVSPGRYVGGKKSKGISGKGLVNEILRSGPADLDEVRRAFTHRGFSAASAAPVLSVMLREGSIRRAAHGRYTANPPATDRMNGELKEP